MLYLLEFIEQNIEKVPDENFKIFVTGLYKKYTIWYNNNYPNNDICNLDEFRNIITKNEFLGKRNLDKQWTGLKFIGDIDTFNQNNEISKFVEINTFIDSTFKFECEKIGEGISHLHPNKDSNIIDTLVTLGYFDRHYGDYGICLKNFLDIRKGDIIGFNFQLTDQFVIEKFYNLNLSVEDSIEILANIGGNIKMLPDDSKYNIYTYKMNCTLI